jgi:twitching motility protein PilT
MAIDRIIDVFPGPKQPQVRLQLAATLRAVVTQVLVPTTRGHDRVPAFEKMVVTAAVAAQIREGRAHQIGTAIQTGRADGMVSLDQSLMALVRSGRVTLDAALAFAPDPEALRRALRG